MSNMPISKEFSANLGLTFSQAKSIKDFQTELEFVEKASKKYPFVQIIYDYKQKTIQDLCEQQELQMAALKQQLTDIPLKICNECSLVKEIRGRKKTCESCAKEKRKKRRLARILKEEMINRRVLIDGVECQIK